MVLVKMLFYTGVRVNELVMIHLDEMDVERRQICITQGKGSKGHQIPLPHSFRELLTLSMGPMRKKEVTYLSKSSRRYNYTDRGVRKMLSHYAARAGITRSMSPHKWWYFLFTWLKKEGIDDARISPTLDMPRAHRWKSTLGFPWLMPKNPTNKQCNNFSFNSWGESA